MLTEYFQNFGLSCDIYQQLYQQHIPGTESWRKAQNRESILEWKDFWEET